MSEDSKPHSVQEPDWPAMYRAEVARNASLVEQLEALLNDPDHLSLSARNRELLEQLEAATSDDFSLVPKAEYARLKGIEEQLETQVGLIRDLASELASVSDIAAAPDGDYERWLRGLLARADAAVTGSGEPGV